MRRLAVPATVALCCLLHALPASAAQGSRYHPGVTGRLGVVATESPAAARIGRAVLEAGGNAADAAAATVFALGVARPQSCGIGGGGFATYRSHTGTTAALDFRETAPAAIQPDTFTGPGLYSTFTGHTTNGIPGTLAGMDALLKRYGTLSLKAAMAPAQKLAADGFRVPTSLSVSTQANAQRLALFPASAALYLPGGTPIAALSTFRNPDLARTYAAIMQSGTKVLYGGALAKTIVADNAQSRRELGDTGLLSVADFAAYRAKWRTPITGAYRGYGVVGSPPPTSGGIVIQEMLNLLSGYDLKRLGQDSPDATFLLAEAQRIAWADRNAYLADPDQVPQPTATLTSTAYADGRRPEIDLTQTKAHAPGLPTTAAARRTPGEDLNPDASTTNVAIVDAKGNAVDVTCTIEQEYGSAVVAPGTGMLLNNELTDFSAPGSANEPRPGRRPRSSIAPTILVKDGRPVLVTGGAGGARITVGVLQTVTDVADFGLSLPQAVDAERVDDAGTSTLDIEDARFPAATLQSLVERGYTLRTHGEYDKTPRVQLAGIGPGGTMTAVSDSRSDQASLAVRHVAPR